MTHVDLAFQLMTYFAAVHTVYTGLAHDDLYTRERATEQLLILLKQLHQDIAELEIPAHPTSGGDPDVHNISS